jgi:hypothetical protein
MIKQELGRIQKGKATLIEYGVGTFSYDDKVFIQIGIAGLFCTKKELEDLQTVINLYSNIDQISECKVSIEGEDRGWMAV